MSIISYPLVINIGQKSFETVNRKRGDYLCHEETEQVLWVKVRLAAVTPAEEFEEAEWVVLPQDSEARACAPNAEPKYSIRQVNPVPQSVAPNAGQK
jgi:hypothetical protein